MSLSPKNNDFFGRHRQRALKFFNINDVIFTESGPSIEVASESLFTSLMKFLGSFSIFQTLSVITTRYKPNNMKPFLWTTSILCDSVLARISFI